MNTIDAILYINLDHRKDRLKNILYQLKNSPVANKINIPIDKIYRIEACSHKIGALGCAQSHIKALNLAIENGWNRVMILEDDFAWKSDTEYIVDCLKKIDSMELHWDVLLLTTNTKSLNIIQEKDNLQKVKNAKTTCGYIVQTNQYMEKLRNCFSNCVTNLLQGKNRYSHAIDSEWQAFQPHDQWYCFKGQLATQICSYSDIENKFCNYSKLL